MSNYELKLLDCTFRDGGYYNQWNFQRDLVGRYIEAIIRSPVRHIEIGFRGFSTEGFYGAYAYSGDDYLSLLDIPDEIEVGVMVNAKELLEHDCGVRSAIKMLFGPCEESPVSFVRIAINFGSAVKAKQIAQELKGMGYCVCVNLMQSSGKADYELESVAFEIDSWKAVDVLYFADSLGNMDEAEVNRIIGGIRKGWNKQIGIHTHNNKGRAISNTMAAVKSGVSWIDSTILGMGRGAGNAQTESLLLELESVYPGRYASRSLSKLAISDFLPLQHKYNWGPNYFYHAAAMFEIHPTYIQQIMEEGRYSIDEILDILEMLKNTKSSSYDGVLISNALNGRQKTMEGDWSPVGWCEGQEVLIIGSGKSVAEHKDGIIQYIKMRNPKVISVNIHKNISSEFVDLFVASKLSRVIAEITQYELLEKPIVVPRGEFPEDILQSVQADCLLNYGMGVEENQFRPEDYKCTLPNTLAFSYAMAVSVRGGATKISLVGFDGYSAGDPKQDEMIKTLEVITSRIESPIVALTPTNYPVKQGSVYALYP